MDRRSAHIKIFLAMILAAMAVFTPAAKYCHVVSHVDIETDGEAWSEVCTLCDIEFPAFEETDNTLAVNIIEREYCVFVPSIIGNLCNNPIESLVIRGPPEV
ncbi:MAG: hypothetical protein IIT83_00480 [Bacteroidales bacterium]|jgi:hypothetical protein|nr:hypothetical protein [Bacteroidales bacterium]MBQ2097657.1 hypothetical protein [Bacteroidales bacterium]MBQ5512134.1 hypothetical protein [Bacteroidales bacterium]MBQ5549918.1 hypothetical protein [Bacteroidales bacterium]MBQ5575432.1 hypothetical protein [Bacteroidales bacterium]